MPTLKKAKLIKLDASGNADEAVDVQFNPETLKIQLSNRVEGGRSQGRQVRQYIGNSSTVFNLDLEFDSADEGSTEEPLSVLEKTRFLEQFIQPKTDGDQSEEKPEKLRFAWGNLIIDGIVESIDMEFDHFAFNGYPLHAKVALSMKEQRIEFAFKKKSGGVANPQAALALGGELPAQMAARLGLDPGNWRGLGLDLSLGLELEAGLEIGFNADISASLGIDIKAGIEAGIDLSLEAGLGLAAGAPVTGTKHLQANAGAGTDINRAVALARAGGVIRATETVKRVAAGTAADNARQAFADTVAAAPTFSLAPTASSRVSSGGGASLVEAPTVPDPRANAYGFGVPLQMQQNPSAGQRRNNFLGGGLPGSDESARAANRNPLRPPWEALPARDRSRNHADEIQRRRAPLKRCGCSGRCHHPQED